jgi:hypothetical protein
MNSSHLKYATQIYAKAAVETADRRELEATVLLRGTARFCYSPQTPSPFMVE